MGFNLYLFNVKILFGENLRAQETTFSKKRILFSLKLLCGHFYGQISFKTVGGPQLFSLFVCISILYIPVNTFLIMSEWYS